MKKAIVVGGSNGIGLALVKSMISEGYNKIIIVDKQVPDIQNVKIEYVKKNLAVCDFDFLNNHQDIDTLIITAGFGRVALFETIVDKEIENSFRVNAEAVIKFIRFYYPKLLSDENFNCLVMGSITGFISSPVFALYAATKAAICRFIESINIELEKKGSSNRILNVSPGSLKGTKFNGGENEIEQLEELSKELLNRMRKKETLFIPDYDAIYGKVLERYKDNPLKFGLESYDYKMASNRINNNPQIKIGYLSGTFDLFHIGHLNLLRRAKEVCDYLVVGVHIDASHKGKEVFIPYEERRKIIESIKYVDCVIMAKREDIDVYDDIKYDYLFVGSDYKGTERFKRYEAFFKEKDVKIIYFPYTAGTSSTHLRNIIDDK